MAADGTADFDAGPPPALAEEAPPPQAPSGLALTFRSLRHRNYRLFFFGQLISLLGSWMQTTALMWLAYELTHQSKWTARIAAAQILPTLILGVWSGALADRWPKRRLIGATQTAFLMVASMLAVVVLGGGASISLLLVIALTHGLVQAIDFPARLTFVMDLVGREDLVNAVGLNSVLFNVARALGPALAGWVLVIWGPGICFAANALSYVAVLIALWRMDEGGFAHSAPAPTEAGSLLDGFRYIAGRPALALMILLAGVVGMAGWPFLSLLPALAEKVLSLQEGGYSSMVSGTGFGALVAAWTVARFGSLERRRLFIGLGVSLLGVALVTLSLTTTLPAAIAACALAGFGLILFFVTSQAVIQLSASPHNRGRVMGIWAMVLSGTVPLGNLLIGPAADVWGEPFVLRAQGVACVVAAMALLAALLTWGEVDSR